MIVSGNTEEDEMEFYVDIADLDSIKKVSEYFPIDGFTTNPKILAKAGNVLGKMMPEYKDFSKKEKLKLFFQVTADSAEDMLKQALKLKAYFGENLVVKLPAVKEGFKAVRLCKAENISVCVTVVHSMTQALIAAKAGADFVAPYISHIDNIGADGVETVREMLNAFKTGNYTCKVLGASFRTADQGRRLASIGCPAVTITPEMFDLLVAHDCTDASMAGFKNTWKEVFGDKEISDFIIE